MSRGLVDYPDDDDDDDCEERAAPAPKRPRVAYALSDPALVCDPREPVCGGHVDDAAAHGQRRRQFAHAAGCYPTHVYCAPRFAAPDAPKEAQRVAAAAAGEGVEGLGEGELHVSLARACALRRAETEAFARDVGAAVRAAGVGAFEAEFTTCCVMANDDGSRSFVCLRAERNRHKIAALIACVDRVMAMYGKQPYYENPVPHVSVAWALGDGLKKAEEALSRLAWRRPESVALIDKVTCKIGKWVYSFDLGHSAAPAP
eukprot:m51a1_g5013 hypothetical protein (259) ;mRNA; f:263747-264869